MQASGEGKAEGVTEKLPLNYARRLEQACQLYHPEQLDDAKENSCTQR